MLFTMDKQQSLEMWIDRVTELEEGIQLAIKIIQVLRANASWSGSQLAEIDRKLEELENKLVPF